MTALRSHLGRTRPTSTPTPGWSRNIAATQTVRQNALNPTDQRKLLEALGLLRPGSNVCVPDDNNRYDDVNSTPYQSFDTIR